MGGDTIGGGVWGSGDRAHIYIYVYNIYNIYMYMCIYIICVYIYIYTLVSLVALGEEAADTTDAQTQVRVA